MIRDYWDTSKWTRVLEIRGEQEGISALLSVHTTGHYHLQKNWRRQKGQPGILSLSNSGLVEVAGDNYILTGYGHRTVLRKVGDKSFVVEDKDNPNESSLDGWQLRETYRRIS